MLLVQYLSQFFSLSRRNIYVGRHASTEPLMTFCCKHLPGKIGYMSEKFSKKENACEVIKLEGNAPDDVTP